MSVLKLKKKPSVFDRTQVATKPLKKKVFTKFRPTILSRHPTHDVLRGNLDLQPFRAIIRLGSTTSKEQAYAGRTVDLNRVVEINTVQAVKNSASKLLMKQCFTRGGVKTAQWWLYNQGMSRFCPNGINENMVQLEQLPYPIIAKSHYGSRGEGNTKLNNQQELEAWMRGKTLSNYIFEKYFMPGNRIAEYRIHCTSKGAFYSCRKMLKRDTPEDLRFQRHSDNCVWIKEDSETGLFDKPENWNVIVEECVKALNAIGLDIGCFDVKVQAKRNQNGEIRRNPDFIIIESNSAPSLAEYGANHYKTQLSLLLKEKCQNNH